MVQGSASVVINRSAHDVFAAVIDVTRMGEFSPECKACRWITPADGAALGAVFEGDNVAKVGPLTLKKWTTKSRVTAFVPGEVFEFSAENHTTWRYEFEDVGGSTKVTESFDYPQYVGWQKFVYETVLKRSKSMVVGMQSTLDRMKSALES